MVTQVYVLELRTISLTFGFELSARRLSGWLLLDQTFTKRRGIHVGGRFLLDLWQIGNHT